MTDFDIPLYQQGVKLMRQPTPDECSDKAVIREDKYDISFAAWHPQWGGYASRAVITIDRVTEGSPGCFDVANFHDGDFPCDEPDIKHYCDARQLVNFGLTVLEKQHEYQRTVEGERISFDEEWVERTIVRLQQIACVKENAR